MPGSALPGCPMASSLQQLLSTSALRSCTSLCLSSSLEQGRVQAFRGWREKGEPDKPREDLATEAGSIPPALRTGVGCEVHPHVCQGTPGICCQQPSPARPPPPREMGGDSSNPSPRSKGVRRDQDSASCHPDPSTARHPRLPEPLWPQRRRPGHHADPWLWEMRRRYPGQWRGGQRSLPALPCHQQHPHPGCRHLARKVTEEPGKAARVTSQHRC